MSIKETIVPTPVPMVDDVEERRERRRIQRRRMARLLGTYLEDLLAVAGGVCFVASAAVGLGGAAALATAGVCLTAYAVAVARAARKG